MLDHTDLHMKQVTLICTTNKTGSLTTQLITYGLQPKRQISALFYPLFLRTFIWHEIHIIRLNHKLRSFSIENMHHTSKHAESDELINELLTCDIKSPIHKMFLQLGPVPTHIVPINKQDRHCILKTLVRTATALKRS